MSSIVEKVCNQPLENKFSRKTIRYGDRICLCNEIQYHNLFYYLQQIPLYQMKLFIWHSLIVYIKSLILEIGVILNISILYHL